MNELAPVTTEGRTLACLSYASIFMGLPFFLIPLLMRKDAFAIHHAKQAAEIYVGFIVIFGLYFLLSFITCGFGGLCFPMVFLPYIPMLHGVMIALNNEWRVPFGITGMVDSALSGVQADQK
ncbi:MAG TPA: hypothetical protein PLA94_32920 [Myxococcota bacterium]|nr:hypothetical protein [Myxococcota bacterium]HND34869.1 hypothetical protein [Myxococcota bacterium]